MYKGKNYWPVWNNVRKEITRIIEELGHLPKSTELIKIDSGLYSGICRYHGGYNKVREKLGHETIQKSNGYYKDLNNIKRELEPIIEQLGHFPTSNELRKLGESGLSLSFKYHGGFHEVRRKLGYEQLRNEKGYLADFNNFKKELVPIIEELGHFPKTNELYKMKRGDLIHAIDYHGGFITIKDMLGYGTIQINSNEKFLNFIKQNETAKDMIVATIALNGGSYDIEKILMDIYGNKFKDQQQLHNLIKENEKKIKDILNEGMTNLSFYIGWYNTEDRPVMPVILGDVIDSIPLDKITPNLEERLTRMLKKAYDSSFYKDPISTVKILKEKVSNLEGKTKQIYEYVYKRYQIVLELHEELNN